MAAAKTANAVRIEKMLELIRTLDSNGSIVRLPSEREDMQSSH